MDKLKNLLRPAYITTGVLLTALTGLLIFITLFGTASFQIHDLTWRIFVEPSLQGKTVLEFPPFGSLSAHTHSGLLNIHVQLEQVGPQLVQTVSLLSSGQTEILAAFQESIPLIAGQFSLRLIFAGIMGGITLSLLIWRRKYKLVLGTSLLSTVIICAALFQIYTTFDTGAFREPQYNGVISAAPKLVSLANESLSKIGKIGDQANLLIDNVESLVASTDKLNNLENLKAEGNIKKILLVSDLHSNPVGIELIKSLTSSFNIDLIIDGGDLTDFGTPLETKTAQAISDLGIPYVFSPGNHETPEMMKFLNQLPNVTLLNGTTEEIQGIKIMGIPDPFSAFQEVETKNRERWAQIVDSTAESADLAIKQEGSPDILVIHNPVIAREVRFAPPLIVSGHTHKQGEETLTTGTLLLNPGTTGAAGLRGLYNEGTIPYSAIILYYQVGNGPMAADFIQYDLMTQHFSLERRLEETAGNPEGRRHTP